jgi:hypothetical protein
MEAAVCIDVSMECMEAQPGISVSRSLEVAIGYAKFFNRSHDAVIRVYDEPGNVIETHEHTGDFKEW